MESDNPSLPNIANEQPYNEVNPDIRSLEVNNNPYSANPEPEEANYNDGEDYNEDYLDNEQDFSEHRVDAGNEPGIYNPEDVTNQYAPNPQQSASDYLVQSQNEQQSFMNDEYQPHDVNAHQKTPEDYYPINQNFSPTQQKQEQEDFEADGLKKAILTQFSKPDSIMNKETVEQFVSYMEKGWDPKPAVNNIVTSYKGFASITNSLAQWMM